MAEFWAWVDALPAWGVLGLVGLLFIALTFILDLINDYWGEWR